MQSLIFSLIRIFRKMQTICANSSYKTLILAPIIHYVKTEFISEITAKTFTATDSTYETAATAYRCP